LHNKSYKGIEYAFFMEFGESFKFGMKTLLFTYLFAFSGLSFFAGVDYNINKQKRIEKGRTQQCLTISNYKFNLDEKEKHLTLVGENHLYNEKEHTLAGEIVSSNNFFASEMGDKLHDRTPPEDEKFYKKWALPLVPPIYFYMLGNGRVYSSLSRIAEKEGFPVYALEDNSVQFLSSKEKKGLVRSALVGLLVAPLQYYVGKTEDCSTSEKLNNSQYKENLLTKRDSVMAEGILKLFREHQDKDILVANVGNAHMTGIKKNLSKKVKLEEIN
jgi:hypothetical protein